MKVLLDTNVVIHREASKVVIKEIGLLFNWIDKLHYEKCIHPYTVNEIRKHKDISIVETFEAKIQNYNLIRTVAPESDAIRRISRQFDQNDNDRIDTALLNEIHSNRVDFLITEDRSIHRKADELGIAERVFTIDDFLEKVTVENPELADYKILSVRKEYFGNTDINDSFFDSFTKDYQGFKRWFNRKADEIAYVSRSENGKILAFLYVKPESTHENYSDIFPIFPPAKRLKIGTFKIVLNGFKLGERFLKIVFDNALSYQVDEIYVTIFDKTSEQERLIELLTDWGFKRHGIKISDSGEELVLVKNFAPKVNISNPLLTYPYFSGNQSKFIVPIYPQYHTELLPDSILRTESPEDFVENRPNRNAIRKVYISRSFERELEPGDIIVFYRTASGGAAHHTSVATTIGVVENVITGISDLDTFIAVCRKRSVFSDGELANHWNHNKRDRPFVVNFLYVHSFPKRLNLKRLKELSIITEAPRGFERLSDKAFQILLEHSNADKRLVVY